MRQTSTVKKCLEPNSSHIVVEDCDVGEVGSSGEGIGRYRGNRGRADEGVVWRTGEIQNQTRDASVEYNTVFDVKVAVGIHPKFR